MSTINAFGSIAFDRLNVLDGGLGSTIEKLGYNVKDDKSWSAGANVRSPQIVAAAHKQFIDAGVDIITTNTYQANLLRLRHGCSEEKAMQYLKSAVEIAVNAVNESGRTSIRIIGSVGPYATALCDASEYTGSYIDSPHFNSEILEENYRAQISALKELGIRIFAFETIPSILEAKAALKVMESLGVYGWVSAQCKDSKSLGHGDDFAEFVKIVSISPNVLAIGLNCVAPGNVKPLLEAAQEFRNGKPFVICPNSGEIWDDADKKFTGDPKLRTMLTDLEECIRLGARVIGGCCRMNPPEMREIAEKVDQLGQNVFPEISRHQLK